MTSPSTPVYVDIRETGPIARITLNRPEKLNAINFEAGLQLYEAFARCESDSAIRAIVLAGAGRAFCAGDELGRERTPDEEMRRAFALDVLACPACGGRLRLIALIFDPGTGRAILNSSVVSATLGDRSTPAAPLAAARACLSRRPAATSVRCVLSAPPRVSF